MILVNFKHQLGQGQIYRLSSRRTGCLREHSSCTTESWRIGFYMHSLMHMLCNAHTHVCVFAYNTCIGLSLSYVCMRMSMYLILRIQCTLQLSANGAHQLPLVHVASEALQKVFYRLKTKQRVLCRKVEILRDSGVCFHQTTLWRNRQICNGVETRNFLSNRCIKDWVMKRSYTYTLGEETWSDKTGRWQIRSL